MGKFYIDIFQRGVFSLTEDHDLNLIGKGEGLDFIEIIKIIENYVTR